MNSTDDNSSLNDSHFDESQTNSLSLHDDTFKHTSIDNTSNHHHHLPPIVNVKLPSTVNVVALRETLLSEAPFITRGNKSFWRRMMDNKNYTTLLSAGYTFLSHCIEENGTVNVDRLRDIKQSPYIFMIAANVTEIIYNSKTLDRDIFFSKLPEIVTFQLISALHTTTPRHHRLYNSKKFRAVILDWCTELFIGIRPCNTQSGREWLFQGSYISLIFSIIIPI